MIFSTLYKLSMLWCNLVACGEGDWLLCWHYTPAKVSHQRWISGNVYYICLCQVRIRQLPLWLWNPEETSPEVPNRGISGPTNGHVSNKNFFLKKKRCNLVWIHDFLTFLCKFLLKSLQLSNLEPSPFEYKHSSMYPTCLLKDIKFDSDIQEEVYR